MMIFHQNWEFLSHWCSAVRMMNFITMMKIILSMNFHHSENELKFWWWLWSQWFLFITITNCHHNDEISSQWWIFITMLIFQNLINFHHIDVFSSQWCIFISMMNFHQKYIYNHNLKYSSIDEFHSNDEYSIAMINFHNNDEFSLWIFIIMMNSNHNDNLSSQLEFSSQL